MKSKNQELQSESDGQAASRKEDHISLAFQSATQSHQSDPRFEYEPILNGHVIPDLDLSTTYCGLEMQFPILVSSMTGGTARAKTINYNLAKMCGAYRLGMGLGSCRQLLYEDKRLAEFDVKHLMPDSPLLINLGIAQIEELIQRGDENLISVLIQQLSADGLIIHINPLQEWMQPEGDRIMVPPIQSIKRIISIADYPIVIKEVGQGFGQESLRVLLSLPLEAVDLAGFGGTNFAKLELLRSDKLRHDSLAPIFNIGHNCTEMIAHINRIIQEDKAHVKCQKIIFSGGVKGFLDGYYFIQKSKWPALYAQASGFLKHALNYDDLSRYIELQIEGLKMSHALLKIK